MLATIAAASAVAALAGGLVLEARVRTGLPLAILSRDWRRLGWARATVLTCCNAALRCWAAFDPFVERPIYRSDREIEAIAPGAGRLKRRWREVAGEAGRMVARGLAAAQSCHQSCQITDDRWDMCLLKRHGEPFSPEALARMPETCRLLAGMGVEMALLSRLAPGTTLPVHTGPSFAVLRYHLCLEGDGLASIRVGDQLYRWRPGEHVVFDETVPHAAHNPRHAGPRLVLFADVVRPLAGLAPVLRAAERATAGMHGWVA